MSQVEIREPMGSPRYSASSYYPLPNHEMSLASRVCDRTNLMYGHAGCRDDTSLWDEDPEVKNTNNHSLTLLPQKITRLPLVPGGPHATPASQEHLGTQSSECDITECHYKYNIQKVVETDHVLDISQAIFMALSGPSDNRHNMVGFLDKPSTNNDRAPFRSIRRYRA